ncbi:MAG: protease inhibitor I9 family protein, partial [Actinoplanes sp.]
MTINPQAVRHHLGALGAAALAGAVLATAVVSPAAATPATGSIRAATSPDAVAGSYLVVLKDGQRLDPATAGSLTSRYGGKVNRVFGRSVHGYVANLSETAARRLAANPAVSYVEQNQR